MPLKQSISERTRVSRARAIAPHLSQVSETWRLARLCDGENRACLSFPKGGRVGEEAVLGLRSITELPT